MNFSKAFYAIPFLFLGCQSVEKAPKPEDLIGEEKMINVLVDMLKVDATISYSTGLFEKRDVEAKDLIFEKYKIDSLQLAQSSAYYSEDFKVNQRIYDSVETRLKRERAALDSLSDKRNDSIRTVRKDHISRVNFEKDSANIKPKDSLEQKRKAAVEE